MQGSTGKMLFCEMRAMIVALRFLFDGGGVFAHSGDKDSSDGYYNRKTD